MSTTLKNSPRSSNTLASLLSRNLGRKAKSKGP